MKISRRSLMILFGTIFSTIIAANAQAPQMQPGQPGAPGQSSPQVAMIMLRVEHNKGKDFIITPKGLRAQVPGKGIASNAKAVAVYQDPQQNFWYIDKHGEPTPVRPEVVQSAMAQFQAQIQQNQMATPNLGGGIAQPGNGAPVQQTTIVQQPAGGGGGGGAGAMGAASMAMSGTALGMSIGAMANSGHNSFYGVPYGHPIYNDNHHYYYNNNSKKVFVNPNTNNKAYFDQFNKQGAWNDRSNWQRNLSTPHYDHGVGRRLRR